MFNVRFVNFENNKIFRVPESEEVLRIRFMWMGP